MEGILEQENRITPDSTSDRLVRVTALLRRTFGCWHRHLSLPFTRGSETYRTCVDCGARRRFDREKWTMVGSFYRPWSDPNERL